MGKATMQSARNTSSEPGRDPKHPSSGTSRRPSAGPEARRAHPRHDINDLEVTLESESNFFLGLTENLSEGGLFIATHLVKPLGTRIEVSFSLPNVPEPIKAIGTVRWVRVYSETSDTGPGMGLRFEDIQPQQVAQIRDFLATRAPLFYDED
jgi:uncharacterized protein (TIGR02266 family)